MFKHPLLWTLLAVLAGTALFRTSQHVHDGREELAVLAKKIEQTEESLRVLGAEWDFLNQPTRLEKLAREHLKLAPLRGSQFVTLEDLPLRAAPAVPAETAP